MAIASGVTPQDEGEGRHQDRPEPLASSVQCRLQQVLALSLLFDGELHDQDGILRRQADGRQQADLEVDVRWFARKSGPPARAPKTPIGTDSITAKGIDQLS